MNIEPMSLSDVFSSAAHIYKNLEGGELEPFEARDALLVLNKRYNLALNVDIDALTVISVKGKSSMVFGRMVKKTTSSEDEDYESSGGGYEDSET